MSLDLTSFEDAIKEKYTSEEVRNIVFKRTPTLALIPKRTDFGGKNMPIPVIYGNPQGRSADFAQAQARSIATNTGTKVKAFDLTRVKNYSIITIDGETIRATKGDGHAFMQAAKTELDGGMNALARDHSISLFRNGFGLIGAVASFTGSTITLATLQDVAHFEVGMEIVVSTTESTAVLRAGTLVIAGVNRSTGVLTTTVAVTTGIAAIAAADSIFIKGDRQDSATPARTKMSGFGAWIPDVAPTSTLFFGADRSVDTRLGGQRFDASAMTSEDALIEGAHIVGAEGMPIDTYIVNPKFYSNLVKSLGSRREYVDVKGDGVEIGFRAVMVNGPFGDIKVIADNACQKNKAWGLALDTWVLASCGELVGLLDDDGNDSLRQATADGIEIRIGCYLNLGCRAPGSNINLTVNAGT